MTAHELLRRHRADELLTRDYESLRREVLAGVRGRLARQGLRLDDADLDAFYNQAWQGLYDQLLVGRDIRNVAGFLVVVCVRRAVDELRKAHLDRRAADEDVVELGRDDDHAARMDDATKLRQFIEGLRDRLTVRECQAATLCYLHDYTRPEAAALLGVEPKRMDKIMDGVSKKVGEFVRAIESGRWCQERGSLMRAYAFGVLAEEGERRRLADDHLASCPPCRSYVRSLRGLGAALPPVALPVGAAGDAGAAGVLEQLRDLLDGTGGAILRVVEEAPERAAAGAGAGAAGVGGAAATSGASAGAGALAAKLAAGLATLALVGGGSAAVVAGKEPPQRKAAAAPAAVQRPVSTVATPAGGPLAARRAAATPKRPKRATEPKRRRRATRTVTVARTAPAAGRALPASTAPTTTTTTPTPPTTAPAPPATPRSPGEFSFESG